MSIISDHVKYQPPFNDVLDEVEQLKVRVEELENDNKHLHQVLYALCSTHLYSLDNPNITYSNDSLLRQFKLEDLFT